MWVMGVGGGGNEKQEERVRVRVRRRILTSGGSVGRCWRCGLGDGGGLYQGGRR